MTLILMLDLKVLKKSRWEVTKFQDGSVGAGVRGIYKIFDKVTLVAPDRHYGQPTCKQQMC